MIRLERKLNGSFIVFNKEWTKEEKDKYALVIDLVPSTHDWQIARADRDTTVRLTREAYSGDKHGIWEDWQDTQTSPRIWITSKR